MKEAAATAIAFVYYGGGLATWVYLTFLDGYAYNWWNWIVALSANSVLSMIWPIYWLVLRPLFG